MHVHLLQALDESSLRTNKDTNGGFGTANDFGRGLTARLLKQLKARTMNFPELLPAYARAILMGQGHDVSYAENAVDPKADVVLIQTSTVHSKAELAWAARAKRESPRIRVGFVGGLAAANPHLYAERGDFVIAGELERALLEGHLEDFEGVVSTGLVSELDDLPFPDWSHIEARQRGYGLITRKREAGGFYPMLTSRGCPMSCGFYCTYPLTQGKQHRSRSPENVVAELRFLKQRFAMSCVLFRDPIFSLEMKRIRRICELVLEQGIRFSWICETHTNCLTPDLVALMARAGCISIKIGVESGDPAVMKKSHRKATREDKQLEIIRCCESHGIKVLAFYILGYMDDDEATVARTIDYAVALNTYGAQFTIATPYPGTPWYRELKAQDAKYQLASDLSRYTQYEPVFRHPKLSAERLRALKSRAYRRYYVRPSYFLKNHLGRG